MVIDKLVCGHVCQNLVRLHYDHDQGENSENDVHHLCERERKKQETRTSRKTEKNHENGVHHLCKKGKVCKRQLGKHEKKIEKHEEKIGKHAVT